MLNHLEIKPFEVYPIKSANWVRAFVRRLVEEYDVPCQARESRKLHTLLYQAHRLGTKTIVIHDGYLCRDYQADYSSQYSKVARPPGLRCVRLLFFKVPHTADSIWRLEAMTPVLPAYAEQLEKVGLIGSAVIRPTADCLVGRTILASREGDGYIRCEEMYPAHLYGTPLVIKGVPWHEQDSTAFVCGGAALYVCGFHTQMRWSLPHYSPVELTSKYRTAGHVSGGIRGREIAAAIKEWGFEPYTCTWDGKKKGGLRKLVSAAHMLLESNISAILSYWPEKSGHAVVAMGHGLSATPLYKHEPDDNSLIRPTTDWVDRFIAVDDQRGSHWSVPIWSHAKKVQPLAVQHVSEWSGINFTETPNSDVILEKCKQVEIYAPFPRGVRIMPDNVLPLANAAIDKIPNLVTPKDDQDILATYKKFRNDPSKYALRSYLTQLSQFHWDMKTDPTWTKLDESLRQLYIQLAWPSWVWVVQIVRLAEPQEDKESASQHWQRAQAIGEILIDATAAPRSHFRTTFAIRIGGHLLYAPDETKPEWLKLTGSPDTWEYPLVCP